MLNGKNDELEDIFTADNFLLRRLDIILGAECGASCHDLEGNSALHSHGGIFGMFSSLPPFSPSLWL